LKNFISNLFKTGEPTAERYSKRLEDSRLPESKEKRGEYANQVGLDGHLLLEAVYGLNAPEWLSQIPVIGVMRRVWPQQY
jgi:transposase